jgi:dimethylaniline monooxygenase (N-oxide forming)
MFRGSKAATPVAMNRAHPSGHEKTRMRNAFSVPATDGAKPESAVASLRSRRIAVIGAGPAGLCTVKELLAEGHDVTCFERAPHIGGLFRFSPDPDRIGVWRSCRLTSSALVTSFSDFPPWSSDGQLVHRHWTHSEYIAYLERYVAEFGLAPHLRLDCEVTRLVPHYGGWQACWREQQSGDEQSLTFDAVAICSGLHSAPHIPEIPGLPCFDGETLHSAHYKDPGSLKGRTAVFIGIGESGGEIIDEASRHFAQTYVSIRRGAFVIPRLLDGYPNDYTGTRLLYSLPEVVVRRSDPEAQALMRSLRRWLFPVLLLRSFLLSAQRRLRRRQPKSQLSAQHLPATFRQAAINAQSLDTTSEQLIEQLRLAAGATQFESFATKTEGFVRAIAEGRAELRPGIAKILPNSVEFEDGRVVTADALVFCTGFERASVPFLDAAVDLERLYLNCFTNEYRESLAFIGFIRPPLGAIPPMAEMQARYFARVSSGHCHLSSRPVMAADTSRRLDKRRVFFHRVFNRLPHLVDFSAYMDELAELIGCKPRFRDFWQRPKLLLKLYTAPFAAVQYRLSGPHARPDEAVHLLRTLPSRFMLVRLVDLLFAHMAAKAGFSRFAPRLTLGRPYDRQVYRVE